MNVYQFKVFYFEFNFFFFLNFSIENTGSARVLPFPQTSADRGIEHIKLNAIGVSQVELSETFLTE